MDVGRERGKRMPVDGRGQCEVEGGEKEMGGGADRGVKNCFDCDSCK